MAAKAVGTRPTLKTVAAEAGVSTATVSFVLSGRADIGISAETKARVRAAAQRQRYVPNAAAQATRTGRTGIIQLSLWVWSDPWSQALATEVTKAANAHGLTATVIMGQDWYQACERMRPDVAFVGVVGDRKAELAKLKRLVERGQRFVVFDEHLKPAGYDVFRSLAMDGTRLAIEYLLSHTDQVGCIYTGGDDEFSRVRVFREAMADRGLTVREDWVVNCVENFASAFDAAEKLLSREDRPRAIFTTSDLIGIPAIHAAQRLGLRVPEDVEVIGIGNTPDAGQIHPGLSTVGPQHLFESIADALIEQALAAPSELRDGRQFDFEWHIVERESTSRSV
ncbi:MAG TPA: LacI family DNA-binding transcriptional regulator [Candidatus Lumbricidophila sp.]|nr:LacI family DNA-binding transcriptional regulator [Candidatus Lumbricidophila sp.]